jgi:hypothetical protein
LVEGRGTVTCRYPAFQRRGVIFSYQVSGAEDPVVRTKVDIIDEIVLDEACSKCERVAIKAQ